MKGGTHTFLQHAGGPSHALERRIGASYGVPHGYTSCVALASSLSVARYRVPEHRWRKPEEAPAGT